MRQLVRDLASPRYAALTVLMVVVAGICVVAGTWQIARYDGKHVANDDLRTNAHDTTAPVTDVLPLVGAGALPGEDAVEFRAVTATGSYDTADQLLVRRQQVSDTNGYTVLTPLRTDAGTLLVVRGFVADSTATLRPTAVPAPPGGTVTVTGRAQPSDTTPDRFAVLGNGQVDSVDARAAAERLGTAVFAGYVQLDAGAPGTEGLTALPAPDLSNPAGGAFELQHLAYVVQWYLFAGLALAAPLVMLRTDRRRAREDAEQEQVTTTAAASSSSSDQDTGPVEPTGPTGPTGQSPAGATPSERLAQRYGRASRAG